MIACLLGSSLDRGLSSVAPAEEFRDALFSVASIDNGRLRMPDWGRLCHDIVLAREGIAALGDALVGLGDLSDGV